MPFFRVTMGKKDEKGRNEGALKVRIEDENKKKRIRYIRNGNINE